MLSGRGERGSVFRTRSNEREVVWIVTDYAPGTGRVSYARLGGGANMGLVDVACAAEGAGTRVTVRYTLTAVTADASTEVAHLPDARHYAEFMEDWRRAISAALPRDLSRSSSPTPSAPRRIP